MQSRTVRVDGIAMRWEEQGAGMPVVLVHGVPTGPALWRHVVSRMPSGIRCLAFEMVGYGASIPQGRHRDISVARQADYLVAWAEAIGLRSAVLAGHDIGGGVAQIAAVRHPAFCRGLFLTNSVCYDSWPIPSVKALRAAGPIVRRLPGPAARQILSVLMLRGHDVRARIRESLDIHWAPYARHGGAGALLRQLNALDVRDTLAVAPRLPQLGIPARIVWGAADPFQRIGYGERLARDLAAPLRRIDGGRHFTPEDHPDVVAEEIAALLTEVGSRR